MTFLAYLRRRCACDGVRIPKGEGWVAISSFERLCERCFKACYAENGRWVHGVRG